MRLAGLALIASLAGCFSRGEPVRVASMPPPPPPPLPCIQGNEDASAAIHDARADGQRVEFCVGDGNGQCFAFDTASGALSQLAAPPVAAPVPGARVAVTNPDLQVCRDAACTSITPQVLPSSAKLHAATTADGNVAIVLLGDAARGKGYAEIWDVAKRRRTAAFFYARGEFRCGEVELLGSAIYISASTCTGPAARAALYALNGRKIANVGGREFGSFGNAHVLITGSTWAFLEENANRLVLQDVARGKLVKVIDTSALWTPDGAASKTAMGNPGEHALLRLGDGSLAIIAGAPATGRVALVDPSSGRVRVVQAPRCASPTNE